MNLNVVPAERENGSDDQLWELPAGWCWTTLDEVTNGPQYGWTTSASAQGKLRFLRTTDISSGNVDWNTVPYCLKEPQDVEGLILNDGDIVISRAGSVGKSFLINNPQRAVFASYLIRFIPKINAKFLFHFLQSGAYWAQIAEKAAGIAIPNVNGSKLRAICLPVAPLEEQRRMVERIESLFTEIAEGEAALEDARKGLETFRRALLKSAVAGELTRDWRENNQPNETGHDLLARIKAERDATPKSGRGKKAAASPPLDTSDLPELPEGWAWAKLDEIIVSGPTNGYSPKTSSDGSGTPSLKLTATTRGEIDLSNRATKTLSELIEPGSDLYLAPGDLLFQRGNTLDYVGISAIFDGPKHTYVYPDLMIRVRTRDRWLAEWIWRVANSPMGRKFMMDRATGTAGTMPKISGAILRRLPIPIPPAREIEEILRRVSDALATCSDAATLLEVQAADAVRLRQAILKSAFEGTLVAQDPADEPASSFLSRLKAQEHANSKQTKRRKKV
jgi:type I restriction enzyme, S subunit